MGIYERSYYRDENELDLRPNWDQRSAVSTLIIINVAVFVANIFLRDSFVPNEQGTVNKFLMLSAGDVSHPYLWWHTFTYGFCHDALAPIPLHLIMNMAGLYFLGRTVESHYGRSEFYRIYLISMLLCGMVWLLKASILAWIKASSLASIVPATGGMLGASGAVLCISMLFVFNFPQARVTMFVFPMPAWVLGILLVLMNLASNPNSEVATDVHLTGILCATAYFFLGLNFRFLGNLQGAWRRGLRRMTGPKLKIHSDSSPSICNEADEADRILAKIHEAGQDSLTSKEKKFLEKYSRSVRAKKQSQ